MIKVPVSVGFDPSRIIGELSIDESALPKEGNYCFALGLKCDKAEKGKLTSQIQFKDCELIEISLVKDDKYLTYLVEREAAGVL